MNKDDFLDLDEVDCIYGSIFALMIKEAFRDDKHFIVAKLKSRGSDKFVQNDSSSLPVNHEQECVSILKQEGKVVSNHFNIYSIMKILFKKRG